VTWGRTRNAGCCECGEGNKSSAAEHFSKGDS
jgi:hypothetical protein